MVDSAANNDITDLTNTQLTNQSFLCEKIHFHILCENE